MTVSLSTWLLAAFSERPLIQGFLLAANTGFLLAIACAGYRCTKIDPTDPNIYKERDLRAKGL